MIDARAARHEPEEYRRRLARKGAGEAFDAWLAADDRWRALVPRVDELRGRTKLKGRPTPEQLEEVRVVKEELQGAEQELAEAQAARDDLALRVPNPPADDVPDGSTEDDVREVRRVGEPPELVEAKEHLELGRFDMERAAQMSGARFGYWIGDTARLALALYRYALDRLADKGFITVLPPVLVRDLGVPYRVVVLPAGDMSAASAKTYDVEMWFAGQGRYRETASVSNTTDFQSRRLSIRVRGEHGLVQVHMLNGTAVVDRMALAILEAFQGEVPDVLRPYRAPDVVRP
jgi:seryl-tRNA synthetase